MIKKVRTCAKSTASIVFICMTFTCEALAEVTPLWKIPLETLTEMQSRPLFSESRHRLSEVPPPPPPPPPVAPFVEAPPETLQATLLGVFRSADDFGLAVLKLQSGEKIKHVKVGETFEGWKLSSVTARTAVFERDGQTVKLQLPKHQFKGTKPQEVSSENNPAVSPQNVPPVTPGSENPSPAEPQQQIQQEPQQEAPPEPQPEPQQAPQGEPQQ